MALKWLESLKPAEFVTSVTSAENQTLQRKPLLGLAVTCVTSVTCKNIATFNLDRDAQGQKPDLAQTAGDCAFSDVTDATDVTALQGNGLSCNVIGKADVTDVTAALADTENQSAETWLSERLSTGAQLAIDLHRDGELLSYTASQLEEARLAIGGRISSMTGNVFWWPSADAVLKLAPATPAVHSPSDLNSARDAIR